MKIAAIPAIFTLAALTTASVLQPANGHVRRSPAINDGNGIVVTKRQAVTNQSTPSFTYDELSRLQKKFLDGFIYPQNQLQAKSINSSLLAPNVQGRVDITRTFTGAELNTEYLFGLFANLVSSPNAFTLLGYPTSYEVTHFTASGNIASASTRFNFTFPLVPSLSLPIQIDTWNAYNSLGQIAQYDATFKWWQWTVDTLLSTAGQALNMTLPQVVGYATTKLAGSICDTAVKHCGAGVPGLKNEDRYSSNGECVNYLTKAVRFGQAYELGRNTLLCRMVHQNMVPFRPEVHCPHIGPSGGGYCNDDKTYAQVASEDFFTNFPFISGGGSGGSTAAGEDAIATA